MRSHLSVFSLFSLFLTSLLLSSCQQDEVGVPAAGPKINVRSHDCNLVCIPSDESVLYPDADSLVQIVGNPVNGNYRRVDFFAYNSLTAFAVEWTYSATAMGNKIVQVTLNSGPAAGGPYQSDPGPDPISDIYLFVLSAGWSACDTINFTIAIIDEDGNVDASGDFNYVLVGECTACDSTFTSTLTCGEGDSCENTLTVTFETGGYSGPVVIQGGLTAKTTICTAEATGGLTLNPDHPSTNSKANVTRWEGDVEACTTYTVTITFSGGDGVGDWSAKDGDGNLLGWYDELECPE